MSRQVRTQMPQTQKKDKRSKSKGKNFDKNACLLVFVLIFSGILIFLLLTASDNKKLNSTLNETFDFAKTRIERYENYNTNDQVKSLVRLMDKTTELSRVIAQEDNLSEEMLDEYANEQRLTGILVLDQNQKVTEQTAKDGDAMLLWQKLIESDYVCDIAKYPQKTYTTRLRNEGKLYDFAAVARQDAAGIVITYMQKEEVSELNGDLTMKSLFADFPFEMNGSIVICDDDKVVSTNKQELLSSSVEESKSLYKNEFKAGGNGIVCLHSKDGNWYGRKEKIKDYDAYIFFPESQVYITRNIVCVMYVLLALLLFSLYWVSRNRTEKRSILQDQKRLRVINALGHAYSSISLVNIKTEKIEIVKSSRNMKPDQKGDILSKVHLEELIQQVITEPFQEKYREFINMSTVTQRLEERETLSFTAQTVEGRWLTIIIVPQGYDKTGKLSTVLVANRDVTEEKEREIERDKNLRNALAAAEHANRAKTAFLNNMSHDIRTPMNAIIGFSDIIAEHPDDEEIVKNAISKIQASGEILLKIINDVLDLSKIESGKAEIVEMVTDLKQMEENLKMMLEYSIQKGMIDFKVEDQIENPLVWCDATKLQQVLVNVLNNAVKFTPAGGTITFSCVQRMIAPGFAEYKFTIKDTGIGMTEEFQKHAFEAFERERTSTESKTEGTGLGLAIVKKLVDLMHGDVIIQSNSGQGTKIQISLPLRIATENQLHQSDKAKEYKIGLDGMHVLLVEDNELNAEIAMEVLKNKGVLVNWVPDGCACVEEIQDKEAGTYQFILMDVQMPRMNGYEATQKIRQLADVKKAQIPIIAMTANAFEEDRKHALDAGMDGFIMKPFRVDEMMKVIGEVME